MDNNRLFGYQKKNINKVVERLMNIDFSNLNEVRELKRKLISGVSENVDYHLELHREQEEFHDFKEYESRNKFGRKIIRILDATIRELENER